jgi:hypothetical protein
MSTNSQQLDCSTTTDTCGVGKENKEKSEKEDDGSTMTPNFCNSTVPHFIVAKLWEREKKE